MTTLNPDDFHHWNGVRKQRMTYQSKDFLDYEIMMLVCAGILWAIYGLSNPLTWAGLAMCGFMMAMFPLRHGAKVGVPLIVRRPFEMLQLIWHKLLNAQPVYYAAIAILVLENVVIHYTPEWPHYTDTMHTIALYAFYIHLAIITTYRTVIFVDHMRKSEHVRSVLMESVWKAQLTRQPNVRLEIVHAYVTGLLTHIVYVAPWFLVISLAEFSAILAPLFVLANLVTQKFSVDGLSAWFYKDHWLGHNSEVEFVYNHGPHHDAIPSGLIAVAGNGQLEGFFRGVMAFPIPFFNPVLASLFYTIDVWVDIDSHQYIPGVMPILPKDLRKVNQHSLHHFGRLEPYGFGIKLDQPGVSEDVIKYYKVLPQSLRNSAALDEELNGMKWDNPRFRWYLELVDKYEPHEPMVAMRDEPEAADAMTDATAAEAASADDSALSKA